MRTLLLALLLSVSCFAGTFVSLDFAVADATSSATVSTPGGIVATAGNLITGFVAFSDPGNTVTVTGVSDSAGNTFAVGTRQSFNNTTTYQFYAKNILAANPDIVTVTLSAATTFRSLHVYQYSGLDPLAPLELAVTPNSGTGTTATSNSFTTTCDNEQIVAFVSIAGTITNGPGYFLRLASDYAAGEDKHVTSVQTGVTATMTTSSSVSWNMHVMAFKDVGATCSGGGGARRRVVIIQ